MAMNLVQMVEWLGDDIDHGRADREVAIRQIASQADLTDEGAADLLDNWQHVRDQYLNDLSEPPLVRGLDSPRP